MSIINSDTFWGNFFNLNNQNLECNVDLQCGIGTCTIVNDKKYIISRYLHSIYASYE